MASGESEMTRMALKNVCYYDGIALTDMVLFMCYGQLQIECEIQLLAHAVEHQEHMPRSLASVASLGLAGSVQCQGMLEAPQLPPAPALKLAHRLLPAVAVMRVLALPVPFSSSEDGLCAS
jgi:hypothetical protein